MRNQPAGLLQWEHDVDVYMPARDAARLIRYLRTTRKGGRWLKVLDFRGLLDRAAVPGRCGRGGCYIEEFPRFVKAPEFDCPPRNDTRKKLPLWGIPCNALRPSILVEGTS